MRRWSSLAGLAAVVISAPAFGQVAISAKAGMIQVADGEVFLADKQIELQPSAFPEIKEGQILRTGEGRAEVLLAPGTFLRMGEDASFKMLNNRLTDTRILLEKGAILVEAMDLVDGNYMTIAVGDVVFNPQKEGLYHIQANPLRIRVYSGEARISGGGQATVVKAGREITPTGTQWATAKFDDKDTDSLYRWSRRRSEYVAKANVSAARSAGTGMTYGSTRGRWIYNSWMGMMTWLPYGDTMISPFGFYYYTPWTVNRFYTPPPVYSGGGYGGGNQGGGWERSIGGSYSGGWAGGGAPIRSAGGGYSGSTGGGSSAGPAPAPAPSAGAAAPVRGGDAGGGRGGAGGGGRQ